MAERRWSRDQNNHKSGVAIKLKRAPLDLKKSLHYTHSVALADNIYVVLMLFYWLHIDIPYGTVHIASCS